MKEFTKYIFIILGALFGALLVTVTGIETWQFLFAVTGSIVTATLGLVVFEGGFLYWGFVFREAAEGLGQMAISLLTSLLDLLFVIAAVALRLGAIDVTEVGANVPALVVVVAVLVNLVAKYIFALVHPDVSKQIYRRAEEGLLMVRAFKAFSGKTRDIAEDIANAMAETWSQDMADDFTARNASLLHRRDGEQGLTSRVFNLGGLFRRDRAHANGAAPEPEETH